MQQATATASGPVDPITAWGTREGAGPGRSDDVPISFGTAFGTIPSSAQIQSIGVSVAACQDDAMGESFVQSVQLTRDGAPVGDAVTGTLETHRLTNESQLFSFDAGMWGAAWSVDDIKTKLGVLIVIGNNEIGDLACHVDSVTADVSFE